MVKIVELRQRRGSYKAKLKQFKKHLDLLITCTQPSSAQLNELNIRLGKIEECYSEYDSIQIEIEGMLDISEADREKEYLDREQFESEYFASVARARDLLSKHASVPDDGCFKSTGSGSIALAEGGPNFLLPKIPLPTFSGRLEDWLEFHDSFISMVHENKRLQNIDKFHYLRAALKEQAANVIRSVDFSANNYKIAWDLLCERYQNKKLLINKYIQSILDIESIPRESSVLLRNLSDTVNKNLRALKALDVDTHNWDLLIIHIVSSRLDSVTNRKWNEELNSTDSLPQLEQFNKFIKNRAELLETIDHTNAKRRHSEPANPRSRSFVLNPDLQGPTTASYTCPLCKQNHAIYQCSSFKSLSVQAKINKAKQLRLCLNCLRQGHDVKRCRLGPCRICSKWHNTALHLEDRCTTEQVTAAVADVEDDDAESAVQDDVAPEMQVLSDVDEGDAQPEVTMSATHRSCVLLSTALVDVVMDDGTRCTARALLDNGSTSCFITEALHSKLRLPIHSTSTAVEGLSREPIRLTKRTYVKIHSRTDSYSTEVSCFIIPHITQMLPTTYFDVAPLQIPADIALADPNFNCPAEIDILLGADIFWTILGSGRISLGKNKPILNSTKFGWLVSGAMNSQINNTNRSIDLGVAQCHFVNDLELQNQLDRFFELESVPSVRKITKEDNECERQFNDTTTRQEDGRFLVRIPLKQPPHVLGDSHQQALTRFHALERKFKRDPTFKENYCKFMQEYIDLDHMSLDEKNDDQNTYVLPHHGVVRESSLTTKLRVVFDASAKSTSGLSFNDIQYTGPTVQDDLISILIRFRQHKYVITSDCEKMYRCVLVAEDQRNLQKILFRFDPTHELKTYKLNTVTYGTASAPYLATRCLAQLGHECSDRTLREIILSDFYVDDFITGHESAEELIRICQGVIDQLKQGKFYLRKWRSNNSAILNKIQELDTGNEPLNLMPDDNAKTLGLHWSCTEDTLQFSANAEFSNANSTTKRSVLSAVSRVFDPLGLISPCILQAKILLQELWALKTSWDDSLSPEMKKSWLIFLESLSGMKNLTMSRRVLCDSPKCIEIHAFSDASLHAYSACLYLRSISVDGSIAVHLVMAKSRVAPLKGMTVPRLELVGALLAVRLAEKVKGALRLHVNAWTFWCDSTIVLGWIRTQKTSLKPFVFNRIHEITEHTSSEEWRYVPTNSNPADIGSRGCTSTQLQNSSLWWSGPNFLTQPESKWPIQPNITQTNLPETKVECKMASEQKTFTEQFSDFGKLQRVTAYILRFIHNSRHRNRNNRFTGHLKLCELATATTALCKIVQTTVFHKEYQLLNKGKQLKPKSLLLNLNPFITDEGIVRVGGRLSNSNYDYDTKHPILLHASHHITILIFRYHHRVFMHMGPQLLLSILRHKFWTIGGRNLARKVTRECLTCCRYAGKSIQPIMADLPKERIHGDFPFTNTAVDYAGPVIIADRKGRGCRLIKSYICVFICLAVRAIHIELVTDLTTNAFIAALTRFIGRRGKPASIFSDNGTNFTGTYNELSRFLKSKHDDISAYASEQAIHFKFSPAYSPHFNGLAEGSVKSIKHHLKRVLSYAHLTYEEMNTVLIQIEGILNSRPLTPLSSDPNDLVPLTPAHFLIGRTITMLPSAQVNLQTNTQISTLPRYQRARALTLHFWNRYYMEYISELQKRVKWQRKGEEQLRIGDMVLVKDERLPPNRWLLGRVAHVHAGPDGIARVADVATSSGILRRAYNRLCLLPVSTLLEPNVPTRGAC